MDFVDPAYAPGTGTPEIGGFTSREAQEFLAGLDVAGCDGGVYPLRRPGQITTPGRNVAYEFLAPAGGKMQKERLGS